MAKKLEKDTQKVLTEQERVNDLVNNDGWKFVKKLLINKIRDNNSINRISIKPGASSDDIARELIARGLASQMVLEWLVEVEGISGQFIDNNALLMQSEYDQIFQVLPERSEEQR